MCKLPFPDASVGTDAFVRPFERSSNAFSVPVQGGIAWNNA
jgi:hypothetical protein